MHIDIENKGGVNILRMNHRDDNRFNQDFLDELHGALDGIEGDRDARALVITGAHEKYFSVGIDIPWSMGQKRGASEKFLHTYIRLILRTFLFPKPVVAAINGHAFAGGFFLSMCCDWRVMREDRGFLCIPEIDLPFDLPEGHVALTRYVVGAMGADYLALSGDRVTADMALELGAVHMAAAKDEVLPEAMKMAEKLGAKDPAQYSSHKKVLRSGVARVIEDKDFDFMTNLVKSLKG